MKIKYTNEKILKQVKENSIFLRGIIVMTIVSLLLIISGPIITYIQHQKQEPLPVDDPKSHFLITIYYAELTEMPESLDNGFYVAEIDGQEIFLSFRDYYIYRQIRNDLRRDGHATIHGTFSYLTKGSDNVKATFEDHYPKESLEKYGYYYFECISGSLLYESKKAHPLGLVFGITILILVAAMCHFGGNLNMIKHLYPACGETKYTQEEIDAQANMEEAIWLSGLGICLAPEIMIGTKKGVTAVKYDEIARIGIRRKLHMMEKRDYYTYRVVVSTVGGKKLIFSETKVIGFTGYDYDLIYKKCSENNPNLVIEEPEEQQQN